MKLPVQHLGEMSDFLVISDVHLRDPKGETTRLFCSFLDSLARKDAEAVFFLGDIFDFIYVGSRFHVSLWHGVFACFERLRSRQIKVYFVEGNHDFGFAHAFPENLGSCFDFAGDVAFSVFHPVLGKTVLRHGDDIVCPASYLPFRRLVKSKVFQKATGIIPGSFTYALFLQYASISRKKDKYRELPKQFMEDCLKKYFAACNRSMDLLIIGHIHMDVALKIDDVTFHAGPDWFSKPSVLRVLSDGTLVRKYL